MKTSFLFAIVAMMLTQVIASPVPQMENEVEVHRVEMPEGLEVLEGPEVELHKIEIPEGQERVELHHGRFRVNLNFKDDHKKKRKGRS